MVYPWVQYLRGIAALMVALKHAWHPAPYLDRILDSGVDLFFIISGFVMVVSTHGRNMSAAAFIKKRIQRVMPMWWVALACAIVLGLATGSPADWASSALLIPYFVSGPVLGQGGVSWGVGWTLVFEAVFYLIFALGLFLRRDLFIFVLIPALVIGGGLLGYPGHPLGNVFVSQLLLEFMFGAAIAKAHLSGARLPAWVGILGLVCFLTISAPQGVRAFAIGLPLAMVFAAVATRDIGDIPILRQLGDASYSIYLFHYMAIMLAWRVVPENSYVPLTFVLGVGSGLLMFHLVERPILRAIRPQHIAAEMSVPRQGTARSALR